MTTTFATPQNAVRNWILIDAEGQVLGRLASRIVLILRGKHKPTFTPYVDTGDHIVVINAAKIAITGRKHQQKTYQRYSGYPGGRRVVSIESVLEKHPDRVLREAVKGMMPNGPLSRSMQRKLMVYKGSTHPHAAQKPVTDFWAAKNSSATKQLLKAKKSN